MVARGWSDVKEGARSQGKQAASRSSKTRGHLPPRTPTSRVMIWTFNPLPELLTTGLSLSVS